MSEYWHLPDMDHGDGNGDGGEANRNDDDGWGGFDDGGDALQWRGEFDLEEDSVGEDELDWEDSEEEDE